MILILGLAAALRVYNVREVPPGNWYDEAINGLDALRILEQPGWPLYFETEGHPREPMYMYLVAGMFGIAGPSHVTLRSPSIVVGLLTIWVVWLLVRDVAGDRRAFLVALSLALLRWHIHFSRTSFRTILTPLFIALVLWALWRAVRTRKPVWGAVAGLSLGLGFATYLAFRVVPVLLVLVGLHAWWNRRRARITTADVHTIVSGAGSQNTCGGGACIAAFVIALGVGILPTAIDAVQNPHHLFKRAGEVTPFSEGLGRGLRLIGAQGRDVALMFFVRGDHVGKHNIPGGPQWAQVYGWTSPGVADVEAWDEARRAALLTGDAPPDPHGHGLPVFNPIAALFFAIGLVLLVRRVLKDTVAFTVLLWMVLIGATSVLSFGAPNYLRTVGMIPAVVYVLVEGLDWARGRVEQRWGRAAAAVFVTLFFVHFGVLEAKRYFVDWPAHPWTWREFNTEFAELGREIRSLPETAAFQVPDYIRTHPTFAFETHRRRGVVGFDDAGTSTTRGFEEVYVVAPVPPYPPAPVPPEWFSERVVVREFRRPDGVVWAVLYRGPAPARDPT